MRPDPAPVSVPLPAPPRLMRGLSFALPPALLFWATLFILFCR